MRDAIDVIWMVLEGSRVDPIEGFSLLRDLDESVEGAVPGLMEVDTLGPADGGEVAIREEVDARRLKSGPLGRSGRGACGCPEDEQRLGHR